jgi:hypothetical protein
VCPVYRTAGGEMLMVRSFSFALFYPNICVISLKVIKVIKKTFLAAQTDHSNYSSDFRKSEFHSNQQVTHILQKCVCTLLCVCVRVPVTGLLCL